MGWIDVNEMLPPNGLNVLVEASGRFIGNGNYWADHQFFIGSYIVETGKEEGEWVLYDDTPPVNELDKPDHLYDPTVHAWMPLPKHYQPQEMFHQEPDLMEHSFFDKDPEWLYSGKYTYEQMTLEEFLGGNNDNLH